MATDLFLWFENLPHVDGGWFLFHYQIWLQTCFSAADEHMVNREWGPLMPISQLVMIERGEGETVSPSIILLTTIVCWFLLAIIVRWWPNVLGCHISSSQNVDKVTEFCILDFLEIIGLSFANLKQYPLMLLNNNKAISTHAFK